LSIYIFLILISLKTINTSCAVKTEFVEETKAAELFLARHVQNDKTCDVQCVLLWTEWVRYHMREKKKRVFPENVRLTEFNEMVHAKFSPALAYDEARGPVYVGIRFVK
jgi:hypothetical protein